MKSRQSDKATDLFVLTSKMEHRPYSKARRTFSKRLDYLNTRLRWLLKLPSTLTPSESSTDRCVGPIPVKTAFSTNERLPHIPATIPPITPMAPKLHSPSSQISEGISPEESLPVEPKWLVAHGEQIRELKGSTPLILARDIVHIALQSTA